MNLQAKRELQTIVSILEARAGDKLAQYRPYPKQIGFHTASLTHRERLLRAGNQQGKTHAGGMEMAYHLTGLYPDWWEGRRIDHPIIAWASSDTGETTRDNPQRALLGLVGENGTGAIPSYCIHSKKPARGVADLVDYAKIKHFNAEGAQDGLSTLRFKYYEQGRQKWQGPPVDVVWYDEEPPQSIYSEGLARTVATGGCAYMTFTPLLGMSEVVRTFLMEHSEDRHDTNMTIQDAEHIPVEEREKIIASFPEHEREARSKGIPTLGSGRIFPIAESEVKHSMSGYPSHWVWLGAIDFGWDHPTAAVKGVWDRDADTVYITQAYRKREATPMIHAGTLRHWGDWLPWAWPHDGLQHDKGSGEQLANQYKSNGLKMLDERITYPDGSNSVEAGIMDMLERMETGRLKVAEHLTDWWDEFRLYHRQEGKVVKEYDDLMSATRYLIMGLRYAVKEGGHKHRFNINTTPAQGSVYA